MSKLWSDFYDWVLPDLPGLPAGAAADHYIREAAIMFCEHSRVWVVDHPAINVVAATPSYALVPGAGLDPVVVTRAEYAGREIVPGAPAELDAWRADWRTEQGDVSYYTQDDAETIRLVLVPQASLTGGLVLKVAVKPAGDATGVDDIIWRQYRATIAHGAKWQAMISPKKTYTNLDLATYHMREFFMGAGRASGALAKAFTRKPLRTRTSHGIE